MGYARLNHQTKTPKIWSEYVLYHYQWTLTSTWSLLILDKQGHSTSTHSTVFLWPLPKQAVQLFGCFQHDGARYCRVHCPNEFKLFSRPEVLGIVVTGHYCTLRSTWVLGRYDVGETFATKGCIVFKAVLLHRPPKVLHLGFDVLKHMIDR